MKISELRQNSADPELPAKIELAEAEAEATERGAKRREFCMAMDAAYWLHEFTPENLLCRHCGIDVRQYMMAPFYSRRPCPESPDAATINEFLDTLKRGPEETS